MDQKSHCHSCSSKNFEVEVPLFGECLGYDWGKVLVGSEISWLAQWQMCLPDAIYLIPEACTSFYFSWYRRFGTDPATWRLVFEIYPSPFSYRIARQCLLLLFFLTNIMLHVMVFFLFESHALKGKNRFFWILISTLKLWYTRCQKFASTIDLVFG